MEPTEIKSVLDEQGRLFKEFREKHDQELLELKNRGDIHPETKASVDAMNARLDAIEVKLARPRTGAVSDQGEQKSAAYRACEKWFRYGLVGGRSLEVMDAEEKTAFNAMRSNSAKALSSQTDAGGGHFIPEDYRTEVIKKLPNIANVSAMVRSQDTSRDVVRWPKVNYTTDNVDSSGLTLTYEDTNDTVTDTDPTPIGSISIQTKKARGRILVDRELLEDEAVNVMDLLSGLIADKIAVDKDRQFTSGAGGKKPEGFMVNADIPTQNSGVSGAFTFDGIMDLTYALPEQYAAGATFMCRRSAMGAIRKLKDGNGRYLWEPSTQVGTPATLNGYPIKANEHVASVAAASRSMIFADFKRLYMAVNKIGLSVQRLDELYAATDQIGFLFRIRFGGAVISPWAGVIQVLS